MNGKRSGPETALLGVQDALGDLAAQVAALRRSRPPRKKAAKPVPAAAPDGCVAQDPLSHKAKDEGLGFPGSVATPVVGSADPPSPVLDSAPPPLIPLADAPSVDPSVVRPNAFGDSGETWDVFAGEGEEEPFVSVSDPEPERPGYYEGGVVLLDEEEPAFSLGSPIPLTEASATPPVEGEQRNTVEDGLLPPIAAPAIGFAVAPVVRSDEIAPEGQVFPSASRQLVEDEADQEGSEEDTPEVWASTSRDLQATIVDEVTECLDAIAAGLARWHDLDAEDGADLRRRVHTLKGAAGMAGAMRARWLIHRMETDMEEQKDAVTVDPGLHATLAARFLKAKSLLLEFLEHSETAEAAAAPENRSPKTKSIRVAAAEVDRLITETNEAHLSRQGVEANAAALRHTLVTFQENVQKMGRLVRDLEQESAAQIESRRLELQDRNADFDPLEMDRFTRLQELARQFAEAVTDLSASHRDMLRTVSDQEDLLLTQERAIHEVQGGLHRTRLIPVEDFSDRLHRVALATANEVGKGVTFAVVGGTVELDRVLLEQLVEPIEHALRNAVAHGIEDAATRRWRNKPAKGNLSVTVRQEAGRVHVMVEDDGAGLNVPKIREKAVRLQLWNPQAPMDDRQAADVVCRMGFSTADALSQIAGRGVGMDVVRSTVLRLGGRFEILSRPGLGLTVSMQVPTAVATASVLVVAVGTERAALPVEIVDEILRLPSETMEHARIEGRVILGPLFGNEPFEFGHLASIMGLPVSNSVSRKGGTALVLREGDRRLVLEVDAVSQVIEAPLRPAGAVWARVPGVVGATVLSDGSTAFVVDPLRIPVSNRKTTGEPFEPAVRKQPLVLVVDDSVTVRQATVRFLERHGYASLQAKDGQEALEILAEHDPDVMLLDVEMPRMDGFECARHVREGGRHVTLPIVMITSRLAAKHRDRATSLGVNGYLGKPFNEPELLDLLHRFAGSPADLALPAEER